MERCSRDILGASISFGPGASIEKVSLSSDYSAVRITNLPTNSGPEYVSQILSHIGIEVPSTSVRMRQYGQDDVITTADVRAEDPNFAKSLSVKFEAGELSQVDGFSGVKVFALAIPASNGAGGFAHRVNCRKIVCSWHKPMKLSLLSFDSEELAKKVCDRFSKGTYKVLDTAVSCGLRQAENPYRNRGHRSQVLLQPRKWVLSLRVPLKASTEDILRMIPRDNRPRHVEFAGTTYRLGEECNARQLAMIEKLLTRIGPLEMKLTANIENPGKRVKAMARFVDEADAKEAAATLDNTRLLFNESDKLNVNLIYSSTYKVATKVFEAVLGNIEAAKIAYKEQHVNFKHFPPTNGYTTLRLEGENREDIAAAERAVDNILRGQTVTEKEGEKPFWNPSFGNRAAAGKALQHLEQLFQVAFHCIPSKAEIRVYGPPGKVEEARNALLHAFGVNPSASHFISLDDKYFQWAIRGGFSDLRDALGPENVILSVLPTIKRIEVIGPRASYDLALEIMSGKKAALRKRPEIAVNDCSVCWTEAENPLTTKCGHVYCLDCFENFCQSADSGESGFNLQCLADEGSCGTVFSLPELQEHLSSFTFEELLASSVKSYFNKRPDEFRYCSTAGCEQIYRVAPLDHPGLFTCPGCLKAACTSCHHPHACRVRNTDMSPLVAKQSLKRRRKN
ncbi:LOW QUALITY PROTEIN: ariadne ring protein [Colletotrichum tofieldiae]|nr:LOW QUALITY PROTEIN: ariadne ring protein [Colletotrichum tofieldiae]